MMGSSARAGVAVEAGPGTVARTVVSAASGVVVRLSCLGTLMWKLGPKC